MAVLGLRFCARAFSSCGKRGPLFIAVHGPLTIAASLAAAHKLQTRRLSNCGSRAPVAPRHVGSSQTRAQTRVPCIGRQTLNHCATREALISHFLKWFSSSLKLCSSLLFPNSVSILFFYWFSVLYILVYICQSNLPVHPTTTPTPLSPLGVHTFVLYICFSISALQTGSSVPFF